MVVKHEALDELEIVDVFQNYCIDFVRARRECWRNAKEGKGTGECIKEELAEKRCLATHFCPSQARRFYELREGECAKWAQRFAFGPSQESDSVCSNWAKQKVCRAVVMELSKCLSKYRKYNPEYIKHKDDF
ncbi:hypothetical protein A3770_02p18490 [Chloropicon primus]|uniref:Uncharacterized protein n=2 Tax=Chloropicon primus TaxID=1764295 RepID=A0A5B8MG77_9CHLO|nr:hypothetical protein A3770_02p18490 [Chloropicon primus]|eukprot:QDZ19331.1 hypothetical protein A3770_02p18490 [Chloropicon primus]